MIDITIARIKRQSVLTLNAFFISAYDEISEEKLQIIERGRGFQMNTTKYQKKYI